MTEAILKIKVDSSDVVRANKSLKDLSDTGGKAEKSTKAMTSATETLTRAARTAAGAIGLGLSARTVIAYADAWQQTSNQLALVTDSTRELTQVQDYLLGISNETRTSVESTIGLYTVLARSTDDLNLSQGQLADLTKTINQSFAITGGSAAGAEGAIRQLSQALAAGALRGDEFNSVNEQAPRLMDAVAESLNMTKGELRDYAATGQITSQIIVKALTESAQAIDDEYSTAVATFGQSMVVAKNNMLAFIGSSDAVSESVANLGELVIYLSELLPRIGFEGASTVDVLRDAWSPWGQDMRILIVSLDMHFETMFSNVGMHGVGTAEAIQLAFSTTLTNIRSLVQIITIEAASISDKFKALLRDQRLSAEEQEANMAALDRARVQSINDVLEAHQLNTEALYDSLIMAREARKEFSDLDQSADQLAGSFGELTDANFAEWEAMMNAKDAAAEMNDELQGLVSTTEVIPAAAQDAKNAMADFSIEIDHQKNMVENLQREWSTLIYDLFSKENAADIGDFFDTIAKGFLRMVSEMAAADLASAVFGGSGGGNLAGLISGGSGILSGGSGLLGSLIPGGGNSMVAPSTAAKGLLGGLGTLGIGALGVGAGALIHNKTNDPDGFHRGMSGFLGAPTPGAPAGSQFSVGSFASGFTPTGFADGPASRQDAENLIAQFAFIDQAITDAARAAGATVDLSRATLGGFGLDGTGDGTFFGRSQATTDAQFQSQINSYAQQLAQHIEGLAPETMAELMGSSSANQIVSILSELQKTETELTNSIGDLGENLTSLGSEFNRIFNPSISPGGNGAATLSAHESAGTSPAFGSNAWQLEQYYERLASSFGFDQKEVSALGLSRSDLKELEAIRDRGDTEEMNAYVDNNPEVFKASKYAPQPAQTTPNNEKTEAILMQMNSNLAQMNRVFKKFDKDGMPETRS